MNKLIILKGLPASGKSTFAKEIISGQGHWIRVNKDLARLQYTNGKWSQQNENFVNRVRNFAIVDALKNGFNVVVDDTNLTQRHERDIRRLVDDSTDPHVRQTQITLMNFDISLEESIKRNAARANKPGEVSIPEEAIHKLYKQLQPALPPRQPIKPIEKYVKPEGKPLAILCDIDGTIAHMGDKRSPYDWHSVGVDDPDDTIISIVKQYYNIGHGNVNEEDPQPKIIIFSGRDSVCRPETEQWLKDNGVPYDRLIMRVEGDNRKDSIIKAELFDQHIRHEYQIMFVLDDRDQVVKMWRNDLGLKVLQVAEGNF